MRAVILWGALGLCCSAWAGDKVADETGRELYLKTCSACHQADGKGIPDAFPALAGNPLVLGKGQDLAAVPLSGRGGMPNFSRRLSNADLAQILSYVRNAWGNKASALSMAQVAAIRADLHADDYDATPEGNQH